MGKPLVPGRVFAQLTLIERIQKTRWRCLCECGTCKIIDITNLYNGSTRSCGCRKQKSRLGQSLKHKGETSGLSYLLHNYLTQARKRNINFDLTVDEFRKLTELNCAYCGQEPELRRTANKNEFYANGIDRRDSTLGYTTENSISCCKICNKMKMQLSEVQFISHAKRITDYRY